MKRKIVTVVFCCVLVLINTVTTTYGNFDLTRHKLEAGTKIGLWLNQADDALNYLNLLKPTKTTQNGQEIDLRKQIAEKIWMDVTVNSDGSIQASALKSLFVNYNEQNLKTAIDKMLEFIDNFLKVEPNGQLKYLEIAETNYLSIANNISLEKGEVKDFYSIMLSADQTYGYWTPITVSLQLSSNLDISDYLVEAVYSASEPNSNQFGYQYRIIDKAFNNTTIVANDIKKDQNTFLEIEEEYSYLIEKIEYSTQNSFIKKSYLHSLTQVLYPGVWSRFVKGSKLAIGEYISNSSNQNEQPIIAENMQSGLTLIGKPNGKNVELRFSIYDRGSWDKESFECLPIIIRLSRASNSDTENSQVNIQMKAVKTDVWF